jgi:hypothetical protein
MPAFSDSKSKSLGVKSASKATAKKTPPDKGSGAVKSPAVSSPKSAGTSSSSSRSPKTATAKASAEVTPVKVAKSSAKSDVSPVTSERKASTRTRAKSTAPVSATPVRELPAKKVAARKSAKGDVKSSLLSGELPEQYGLDLLVAIPKDPEWTHVYWDLRPETRQELERLGTDGFHLRGFDTTGILFDGNNAPVALDLEVAPYSRSWYLKLPYQGRIYTFEYGVVKADGQWHGVARSQPVGFEPGMIPSRPEGEEWVSIASDELFRAAAGLSEGEGIQDLIRRLRERAIGGSHAMGGAEWLSSWGSGMGRMELAPSSWAPSSYEQATAFAPSSWSTTSIGSGTSWTGVNAGGQLQPPRGRNKDFWLWVETELILYGATEPDAQVTLMGRPIKLNPDGTFRVHFPFPHGTELHMDVRAVDKTGEQVREAKPAAKRWTE